jgi:hypothetical protein
MYSSENILTYGAELSLRSCQLCSHSGNSSNLKEPEGSQEPSTGPYPEPVRSSPYHPILYFLRSILILSTHLRVGLPSCLFWLSHQYPICIPRLPHSCYMPCPSHPPWLDHSNCVWRGVQSVRNLVHLFLILLQLSPEKKLRKSTIKHQSGSQPSNARKKHDHCVDTFHGSFAVLTPEN